MFSKMQEVIYYCVMNFLHFPVVIKYLQEQKFQNKRASFLVQSCSVKISLS